MKGREPVAPSWRHREAPVIRERQAAPMGRVPGGLMTENSRFSKRPAAEATQNYLLLVSVTLDYFSDLRLLGQAATIAKAFFRPNELEARRAMRFRSVVNIFEEEVRRGLHEAPSEFIAMQEWNRRNH